MRIQSVTSGQQAVSGGRQVLLHVSVAARGDQRRHDPGRGDHVHRAIPPVNVGQALQRMRQFAVLGLGCRPAQQRQVTGAGFLVQPLGQTPHQVQADLVGEHFTLALLGQAKQAERGDGPVAGAGPLGTQLPAAVRPPCPGQRERELSVHLCLGQGVDRQPQQTPHQGGALGVLLGKQVKP